MKRTKQLYIVAGICFLLLLANGLMMLADAIGLYRQMTGHGNVSVQGGSLAALMLPTGLRSLGYLLLCGYCFYLHRQKVGMPVFLAAMLLMAGLAIRQMGSTADLPGRLLTLLPLLLWAGLAVLKLTGKKALRPVLLGVVILYTLWVLTGDVFVPLGALIGSAEGMAWLPIVGALAVIVLRCIACGALCLVEGRKEA